MPGRKDRSTIDISLCRRCQVASPDITIRNEALCKACFCKYVSSKVVKRMESFRTRHAEPGNEPTLLLALSLGAGSISLLQLLTEHLKMQMEKSRRIGFKLRVLYIEEGQACGNPDSALALLEEVKLRFPAHEYSSLSLSDIFAFEDLSSLLEHASVADTAVAQSTSNADKYNMVLTSMKSATSRADLVQILKRKLIVKFANANRCDAILFGDSTTKLAERTLAETAKGRGFALPWIGAEGGSPYGISIHYPMRDLLSKEIAAFVSLSDPPLDDLLLSESPKQTVSIKDSTIDDLMTAYFASVEQEYPSIVANVVKTSGKLQPPSLRQIEQQCELCDMPLLGQAPEKSRLCHGCVRTFPQDAG